MEFFKSEKKLRIPKISGFWGFFQIFKIPLLSTSKTMQSVLTFSVFPAVAVQIYVGALAGKVVALCMTCKGT